jgi:phosphocarrier protein
MKAPANQMTCEVEVVNSLGIHARTAANIAKHVRNAKSKLWLVKGDQRADAADMLDILALHCPQGTRLQLIIEDAADRQLMQSLAKLFAQGFGE